MKDYWLVAFQCVKRFEELCGEGESRGACRTIAENIQKIIGGTIVCGYIRMRQGDMQHWWVEKESSIIDPLAILWMDEPYEHIKKEKRGRNETV